MPWADIPGSRQPLAMERGPLKADGDTDAHTLVDTAQVLPEGERRQATIVILGLSGYRGSRRALHFAGSRRMMRRLKRETWEIVERHGGTINEFSEERVVLVFGVPISREDHCVRATRAASSSVR